jgi:hypothetical protein
MEGKSAITVFNQKIDELNGHARKEGFDAGETCDRLKTATVAESNSSGIGVWSWRRSVRAPLTVLHYAREQ